MIISWIGFFVAIAILLLGARYHLGLALITGAVVLGLFTITPFQTVEQIYFTLTDPSIMILTLALTMIPIIGGVLQESGELDHIVNNLRIGKKPFLGTTPSLLGLLPIPGGALFSAPLIEKAGKDLKGHIKTGINVWFRHILFFIYPLAPALIVPVQIANDYGANIDLYVIVTLQIPIFLVTAFLGYFFLLRKADGEMDYSGEFSLKLLLPPLGVIILAPLLDYILKQYFRSINYGLLEVATFIAIASSLFMSLVLIDFKKDVIKDAFKEMKPWNFTVMIFGIFLFINIFKVSGTKELISGLSLSPLILTVGAGFLLGLITGRINLPASLIIPIYITTFGVAAFNPVVFIVIFLSVFMGYVLAPVHPCVSISLEFFDADMSDFIKLMIPPVAISLGIAVLVYFLLA